MLLRQHRLYTSPKTSLKKKGPKTSLVKKIFSILIWVGVIVLIIFLIDAKEPFLKDRVCPDTVKGNQNASFIIKYFYTPYCPYCWLEAPILDELVVQRGTLFTLEYYDYRFCAEAQLYRVPGIPSFVFLYNETEKLVPGFMAKAQLEKIICGLVQC